MGIAITPELEIIFDTVKSSRKYPNLVARPSCAFVAGGWGATEQTVQYEGEGDTRIHFPRRPPRSGVKIGREATKRA